MIGLLIGILFLFGLCAFLAAAEMAFISIHPVYLREQAEKGERGAASVLKLRENNQHFLGTVLIATNMTQVALTALMSYLLESHFSIRAEWLMTLIMAPLMLVFCEMLPKEYARLHALAFLKRQVGLLMLLYKVLYVPAHAFMRATEILFPKFKSENEKIFTNEEEFKALVSESQKTGVLDPHERDFVNMILDFERIPVRSVMIPLNQTAQVELSSDLSEVRKKAREGRSKMVLVYEEAPEIVAGVIYVFDLLVQERENGPLTEFLKAPLFIPEKMSLEEAFRLLQKKRQSFALVTDASYEVQGVVLIENLLLGKQA